MGHILRHYPPGSVAEITFRTREGRFALVPRCDFTKELIGRIWQAHRVYPGVELYVAWVGSNHAHLLLSATSAAVLAAWMGYLLGNTTKLSQRVFEHNDVLFTQGYTCIPILDQAALASRVRYIFDQATVQDLVRKPAQWPGLQTVDRNCRGTSIIGYFADADIRRKAKRAKRKLADVAPRVTLPILPLPFMRDWTTHAQQRWFQKIEKAVIADTRKRQKRQGTRIPKISTLRGGCHKRRAAPLVETAPPPCHTTLPEKRAEYLQGREMFVDLWYQSKQRLIDGHPLEDCGFTLAGWLPLTYPAACAPETPEIQLQ